MPTETNTTIDAAGKRLGRVAALAAQLLMGKTTPQFQRHIDRGLAVTIINAGKLVVSEKKARTKTYERFSGYPSGLKIRSLAQLRASHGIEEIVRKAVQGMLPKNRLRPNRLKRLTISK